MLQRHCGASAFGRSTYCDILCHDILCQAQFDRIVASHLPRLLADLESDVPPGEP